jgi:hypothetical protein
MDRMQLFRESWTMLVRHQSMWTVALIGLAIDFVAGWVSLVASPAAAILRTLVAFVITAFTTGALISMIDAAIDGQAVGVLGGLQAGFQRLIPLLLVSVVLFLPIWVLIVVLSGSVTAVFTSGLGQPDTIQAATILQAVASVMSAAGPIILLSMITAAIGIGAERAIVLDDRLPLDALKYGWQLLSTKVREYFMIGLWLFGLVLGIGLVFALVIAPLLNSLVSSALPTGSAPDQTNTFLSPDNVIFIILNLVVNSLYVVFVTSIWTMAYRQWRDK